MINLENVKELFKNHVATFTDYGNIKILDFKNPKSTEYRIRFLFEEDYCRLHISGDLGELIATNFYNMTYEKFGGFVHDTGYFKQKINCSSRSLYAYNEKKAADDLRELFNEHGITDEEVANDRRTGYENIEEVIEDILNDLDDERGIGPEGHDVLSLYLDDDTWEYAGRIGKEKTGILDVYMLAFQLAKEQLARKDKKKNSAEKVYTTAQIPSTNLLGLPRGTVRAGQNGKQMPKYPLPGGNHSSEETFWLCPNCCQIVGDKYGRFHYCPDCGQQIEWDETNGGEKGGENS